MFSLVSPETNSFARSVVKGAKCGCSKGVRVSVDWWYLQDKKNGTRNSGDSSCSQLCTGNCVGDVGKEFIFSPVYFLDCKTAAPNQREKACELHKKWGELCSHLIDYFFCLLVDLSFNIDFCFACLPIAIHERT